MIKTITTTLIISLSFLICVFFINSTNASLEPYFVQASNRTNEDAVDKLLKEKYPLAYFPFNNLDNKINSYSYIDHINELAFTQAKPLYAYTLTTSAIGTSITYVVVFDSLGYIDNIYFLNGEGSMFYSTFYAENGIVDTLVGSKAPYITTANQSIDSSTTSYIRKGVESAALNFVYEVKSND